MRAEDLGVEPLHTGPGRASARPGARARAAPLRRPRHRASIRRRRSWVQRPYGGVGQDRSEATARDTAGRRPAARGLRRRRGRGATAAARHDGRSRKRHHRRAGEGGDGVAASHVLLRWGSVQQSHLGALELVQRSGFCDRDQSECRVERAGSVLSLSRGERTLSPAPRLGRQLGRPLEKCGRRRQPSARLSATRRALKLGGDVLVKTPASLGQGAMRDDRDRPQGR